MVGRLVQLVENAHLTPCPGGSGEDGIAEMILGNHLRATERKEDAALLNLLESLVVQAGIALEGIVERTTMLGEGGRIEDDEVVLVASLFEILKGILTKGLMALIVGEIQFDVAVGEFDGLGTTIDGMDELGPTPHSVKRKTASIAEHVEYALASGVAFEQGTIFALVDEETGLLTSEPVDIELQTVLKGDIIVGTAIDKAILHIVHKGQRGLALVIDILQTMAHDLDQLGGNGLAAKMHADAVGLHDGSMAIDIDDESWQQVALTMNEAVGVVVGIVGNTDGSAHLIGRLQARSPEFIVDLTVGKREHTHSDGARLIMTYGDEIATRGDHTHDVALVDTLIGLLDGPGKHPGVEAQQTLFLTLL